MGWFLDDNGLRLERVNCFWGNDENHNNDGLYEWESDVEVPSNKGDKDDTHNNASDVFDL